MDIHEFLRLSKTLSDLGDAIGGQLRDVVDGADVRDQNINAMRHALKFLRKASVAGVEGTQQFAEEIEDALKE